VTPGLAAFLLSLVAAYGVFLVYTAVVFRWRGFGVSPSPLGARRRGRDLDEYLTQAGLENVRVAEFAAVSSVLFIVGVGLGWAIWGGWIAPAAVGLGAASFPLAAARSRRASRREQARENWPRLIEEIRLQTVSLGRPVPEALLSVGLRGPEEMQPAFRAAQREWLISTDFDRTLTVLKDQLADPTADAVCETLLIAHEVGGTDVDRRLRALIDDRVQDLQGRKDAKAKQAGARFARLFVLIVPVGMAIVGMAIGDGRAAYASTFAQLMILIAFSLIAVCWIWAGHLMKIPEEERVFSGAQGAP
jgi:tight adherence protein B